MKLEDKVKEWKEKIERNEKQVIEFKGKRCEATPKEVFLVDGNLVVREIITPIGGEK